METENESVSFAAFGAAGVALRAGDTLIVRKLDRLGRSLRGLTILDDLARPWGFIFLFRADAS